MGCPAVLLNFEHCLIKLGCLRCSQLIFTELEIIKNGAKNEDFETMEEMRLNLEKNVSLISLKGNSLEQRQRGGKWGGEQQGQPPAPQPNDN